MIKISKDKNIFKIEHAKEKVKNSEVRSKILEKA